MNTETLDISLAGQDNRRNQLPITAYSARARVILQLLAKLQYGALHLHLPDGRTERFGDHSTPVTMRLHDWSLFDAVLKAGDIGLAETFIAGSWTTDDLTGLIRLFIRNRQEFETLIYGSWWGNMLYRLRHLFNRNSRRGSRKNIHAHYDLGNSFYRLWLDPSMTYSSALFGNGAPVSLHDGQLAKYRRILKQLRVTKGTRILELGCGWGGFAKVAAMETGALVHGLTLSVEQLRFAQQGMAERGLAAQVDLQLMDYRDCHGQYDAIASIEMFEAVGEAYWPDYFECVARNLKQGGRACIQTIVIADELFERYRTGTDFIQQYIFPGGMLPSPSRFRAEAAKRGLKIVDEFAFGLDYARTLVEWRDAFKQHLSKVRAQGFDDDFLRTWEFYLSYSEAGFRAANINVMQFTLEKT